MPYFKYFKYHLFKAFKKVLNPSCDNKDDLPDMIFSFYTVKNPSTLSSVETVDISLTPDEYMKSYEDDGDISCDMGIIDHKGMTYF